ncbi:hypothetical protein [Blastococcus deserti]|uniref:Uncharacterized protein n=1 Tax=Blastococcus deserti TaxID=2259033 RepID=A0ABW4XCV5_9ACTN
MLPPGGTRLLQVAFTPGAEGERTASLEFEANVQAGPHRVALTGTGTAP